VTTQTVLLVALIFLPMLVEASVAARNERNQRARGGVEPPGDVYRIMRVAYPAAFVAMIAEGAWDPAHAWWLTGLVLFVVAKALKWWAIAALGPAWTFRVIVRPGVRLVAGGPYRFLRHPNYVGVAGELVGVALMSGARLFGPLMTVMFCGLMLKRIAVEDRALELVRSESRGSGTPFQDL
jgi:methyltransferase